jgi:quercetin dioxygenase-like cupin family protein
MNILHIDNAEVVKNPHGVKAQKLHKSEYASILQITFKPSEKLRKHAPPVDVIFYVIEGKGIIEIGDEKKRQ